MNSLRQLAKRPGFTLTVIVTLGLGIAAATTLFSIARTVVFNPLPYAEPDRAVMIWSSWKDFPQTWVSYDEYEAYREEIPAFDHVAIAYSPMSLTVGGIDEPELVQGSAVSGEIFAALGVQPQLGRPFLPTEQTVGAEPVAIIGFDLWQRRFAADPDVVGRTIDVGGDRHQIVGVMPADFRLPMDYGGDARTEVLLPLAVDPTRWEAVPGPDFSHAGGAHTFYAVARLGTGASVEHANAQLEALTRRLNADGVYPAGWDFRATAVALPRQVTGALRPALWVVGAGVALLLAIACANVAALTLIRGEHRRREFGIRTALGAGPGRLARQVLTESATVSVLAGALGFVAAGAAVQVIRAMAPPNLPRMDELHVDTGTFAFSLLAAFVSALAAALVPTLRVMRTDPARAVKSDADQRRSGISLGGGRSVLVTAEIALAVLLAVAAGLMIRTVESLLDIDPGFRTDNVAVMRIAVPSSRYPEGADVTRFYQELDRRVAALPGVEATGAVRLLPLDSEIGDMGIHVAGYQPPPGEQPAAEWQVVLPGYFQALGIELVGGRYLDARDADNEPTVVINRRFAERYFGGRDPLGREVILGRGTSARIVGIVADTVHNGLLAQIKPRFYVHHAVVAQRTMNLVVRARTDPAALAPDIRREVQALDPRLAVSELRYLSDIAADVTARPRFVMLAMSAFAFVALMLSAVGVYATLAYLVSRSTREIGIRMSLGAGRKRIFADVTRRGLAMTLAGTGIGLFAAMALARFLGSLLVGVAPFDPATYAGALALFVVAGAVACAVPAFRATCIQPAVALRQE